MATLGPIHTIEAVAAALKVPVTVVSEARGPAFTRYGLRPGPKVRVRRVQLLAPDLALALGVESVRIDPDPDAIGLEVPRADRDPVPYAAVVADAEWPVSPVAFALGRDVGGRAYAADLARMPHLLIAGATGSGKSVALNVLLTSMLERSGPDKLRLALIDAKRVELAPYANLAHLVAPVATEIAAAEELLAHMVGIVEGRYRRMAATGARSVGPDALRYVIVVDELTDLLMQSKPSRKYIIRLAQIARAAGCYLVLATQRPSADIIDGLLKANVPGRISFATSSAVDSRVILDVSGAEALLGRGDMLYRPPWLLAPVRLQGAWITDDEIAAVCARWERPAAAVAPAMSTPAVPWRHYALGLGIGALVVAYTILTWIMG
jgi:S-DNA-T family DNA segregation ATPase FtsK/SpoIIIE